MLKDHKYKDCLEAVYSVHNEQRKNRLTSKNLIAIGKILLDAGADPNHEHGQPIPGYTPLMLAAESDETAEIFEYMLQKSGNPQKTYIDHIGQRINCWIIATAFKSAKIIAILKRSSSATATLSGAHCIN